MEVIPWTSSFGTVELMHALSNSGNGLLSHYINLVLESIDITGTKEKATIYGCLRVCCLAVRSLRGL